jgi:hypothetical protein
MMCKCWQRRRDLAYVLGDMLPEAVQAVRACICQITLHYITKGGGRHQVQYVVSGVPCSFMVLASAGMASAGL